MRQMCFWIQISQRVQSFDLQCICCMINEATMNKLIWSEALSLSRRQRKVAAGFHYLKLFSCDEVKRISSASVTERFCNRGEHLISLFVCLRGIVTADRFAGNVIRKSKLWRDKVKVDSPTSSHPYSMTELDSFCIDVKNVRVPHVAILASSSSCHIAVDWQTQSDPSHDFL